MQMADNAAYAMGKNLYTGGELVQRFLPTIMTLFHQRPVPRRMVCELLLELKDLVYVGMAACDAQVLASELDGEAIEGLEEVDNALVKAVAPPAPVIEEPGQKRLLRRKTSSASFTATPAPAPPQSFLSPSPSSLLRTLESLETTAHALSSLPIPIPDFCAHTIITLRRLAPRPLLAKYAADKKQRQGRCAEYATCMKWAGASWRDGGGCRRGCKNEDEDPENLPSWHRTSRWFDEKGNGTCMVGGGRARKGGEEEETEGGVRMMK